MIKYPLKFMKYFLPYEFSLLNIYLYQIAKLKPPPVNLLSGNITLM